MKECGRNPLKLLVSLLLGLFVILWVPKEVPTPMDTLWKEVTPSALQWENPQEAEYAWTGRDALEMSLLPKPLQALSPMLKASHPS